MRIKRAVPIVAAGLSATLLAACGGGDAGDGTSEVGADENVTLEFVGADDAATYEPVIAAFEAENPNIQVEYTQIPLTSFTSTMQQRLTSEDSTIDVYTVNQPNLASNAAQGFLVDLTHLAEELEPLVAPDQYEVNFYDDKMWSVPVWTSTQMLFYNKDALDDAGVPAPPADPTQPMTWEEVADLGAQVQDSTGIESGLTFEATAYYNLQPLAESLGGGSGVTGSGADDVDLTNEGWTEAMEWFGGTFDSGLSHVVPPLQGQTYFMDGNTAYYVGGPWDIGIFADSDIDWGVAPMPGFAEGDVVTPTGSWSWGISPFSENQEAAMEFLEFGSLSAEGNLATTEATTIIPSNLEAMDQYLPGLEDTAGEASAGVADIITYAGENTAVARPTTVGYAQFEQLIDKAFNDIANGADPSARLAQAEEEIKAAWRNL